MPRPFDALRPKYALLLAVVGYASLGELLFRIEMAKLGGSAAVTAMAWLALPVLLIVTFCVSTWVFVAHSREHWVAPTAGRAALAAGIGCAAALILAELRMRAAEIDCLYCPPWTELAGPILMCAAATAAVAALASAPLGYLFRRIYT
jgi:hypothetical protein